MSRSKQLVINGIAALMSSTGAAILGLAVTPIFLAKLGLEEYGVWALANGVITYAGLAELGLGSTFVKSLAEYAALKEDHRVRQVMTFGTLFYLAMTLVLTPLVVLAAPRIVSIFKLPPGAVTSAETTLVLVFVYALLSRALGMPSFLLTSLGYLRIASTIAFVSQVAFYIVSVVFLMRGFGIYALMIALYVRLVIAAASSLFIAARKIKYVYGNPFAIEPALLRRLFSMSSWVQITDICSTINFESDRVIIGAFVAVADVSYYDVANRLARTLRSVPLSFINAFLPAMSALDAKGDGPSIGTLYVEASRYFMLATAVLLGYLAAAASPIISVWLGASMSPAVSIMLLLCVTYVISNMTVVGSTMVRAIGRPRFETEYSVINASVNVVASLILVHPYSYFGVVLGTLCGAVAGLVYFQWMLHRVYAIPVGPGLISWFWKIAVATLAGGAVVWAALHFADPFFAGHRLVGLIAIGLAGIVYLAIVGGMLIALRFFGDGDLARLRAILPRQLAGRFMPRAS